MIEIFDVVVGVIMTVSVVMAFFRGFVKELFTILSWLIATVLTVYLSPVIQNMIKVSEGKKAFYDALVILAIFSLAMVILSFIFGRIIHHLKKNDGLFLDRSLGTLFGIVRGSLLICLSYIFVVGFVYEYRPEWVRGKSVKLVEIGAKNLVKLNPKNMNIDFDNVFSKVKNVGKENKEEKQEGYSDRTRKQVEDLIKNGILQQTK
ncbi:MAG: CvpA family protein [Alphaproteobacteria bacterium]|nr:CvpA family protein [Alphaproteobacteria bacterium]